MAMLRLWGFSDRHATDEELVGSPRRRIELALVGADATEFQVSGGHGCDIDALDLSSLWVINEQVVGHVRRRIELALVGANATEFAGPSAHRRVRS